MKYRKKRIGNIYMWDSNNIEFMAKSLAMVTRDCGGKGGKRRGGEMLIKGYKISGRQEE